MISTLRFGKHFRRVINNNNRVLFLGLDDSNNKCTYHQQHYIRQSLQKTDVMDRQIHNSIRYLSSSTDNPKSNELIVRHNSDEGMFYIDVPFVGLAFIDYERKGDLITLKHTDVPKELGGQGIGKILAKEALDYVAKNDLKLEIQCTFIRNYVSKYEPKYIKYIQK